MNILGIFVLIISANARISSDWADPSDLYNYDRHTKTMKNLEMPLNEVDSTDVNLLNGNQNNENLEITNTSNEPQCDSLALTQLFLHYKRLINQFKNAMKTSETSNNYELKLKTSVRFEQYLTLVKLGESKVYDRQLVRQVESIISEIIEDGSTMSYFDKFNSKLDTVILYASEPAVQIILIFNILLSLLYFVTRGNLRMFTPFSIVLCFLGISYIWTYYKLVEEEEIKLEAERMRHNTPPNCSFRDQPQWSIFLSNMFGGSLFASNDECYKYVKAFNKKAWKTVTPSYVLSHTLGDIFSTFLDILSRSITTMFFRFYDRFGVLQNILFSPFIFVFIFFIFTLILTLVFKRSFRIGLFGLFNYEILSSTTIPVSNTTNLQPRTHVEEIAYNPNNIVKKPKIKRKKQNLPIEEVIETTDNDFLEFNAIEQNKENNEIQLNELKIKEPQPNLQNNINKEEVTKKEDISCNEHDKNHIKDD